MTAGYNPEYPGIDEARLDAYKALIVSKLATLNQALRRDRLREVGEITSMMVEIGDNESSWDIATGPLRFRIVAGGEQNGQDFQAALLMGLTGNAGWSYEFATNIYVYVHPDAMANADTVQQAEDRERLLSRVSDWITFGVCNVWDPITETGGAVIQLNSHIFNAAPKSDYLVEAMIKRAYKGWRMKGFGSDMQFPCIELIASASIM